VQASPDQNNRNARADILLSRRKEKLKHEAQQLNYMKKTSRAKLMLV
jgi:hypothetical protein